MSQRVEIGKREYPFETEPGGIVHDAKRAPGAGLPPPARVEEVVRVVERVALPVVASEPRERRDSQRLSVVRPPVGREAPSVFRRAQNYVLQDYESEDETRYIISIPGQDPMILNKIGVGSYRNVYANAKTVWKIFSPLQNRNQAMFPRWTETSLLQFEWLKAQGIPCASILNDPMQDGFIVQERVALLKERYPLIEKRDEYTPEEVGRLAHVLETVSGYFVLGIECNKDLDPALSNIGVNAQGVICLFDFKETDDSGDRGEFYSEISKCLRIWNGKAPQFTQLLKRRIAERLGSEHPFVKNFL